MKFLNVLSGAALLSIASAVPMAMPMQGVVDDAPPSLDLSNMTDDEINEALSANLDEPEGLSPKLIKRASALQDHTTIVHNRLRARHGVPDLGYSSTLAAYAQRWADNCNFAHSHHSGYGENLAAGYPLVGDAIEAWWNEIADYDFNNPGYSAATGHFTQVVWKSTTTFGCGVQSCDGENGTPGRFLVCEYTPQGNIVNPGYFSDNVKRCQYDCQPGD